MGLSRKTRKRLTILAVFTAGSAVALGGAYTLWQVQRSRKMESSLRDGMAAHAAGDHKKAVETLGYYVGRNSKDGDALMAWSDSRRRVASQNNRHLLAAAQAARQAADAMPGNKRPLVAQIELYRELQFFSEMQDAAERLLRIDPKDPDAMVAQIESLVALRKLDEALRASDKLIETHPDDSRGHAAKLSLMTVSNMPAAEAAEYADRVAKERPQDFDIAVLQAQARARAGDVEGAKEAMRRVAGLKAPKPEQIAQVSRMLDLLNMTAESDRFLAAQAEGGAPNAMAPLMTERAWKHGNAAEARRLIAPAIESLAKAPDDALGWAAVAAYGDAASAPTAEAARAELAKRTTSAASAWIAVIDARALLDKQDWRAARDMLQQVADRRTDNGVALAYLGEAEANLGETSKAISRWQDLLRRDPKWMAVHLSLITVYLREGRTEEAFQQAASLTQLWPTRSETVMALGRTAAALAEAGRAEPAVIARTAEILDRVDREGTGGAGDGTLRALKARILAAGGRVDEAQKIVDTMIAGGPRPQASDLVALSSAMQRRGVRGAEKLMEMAGAADSAAGNLDVLSARASEAARAGRADEGAAVLRAAASKAQGQDKVEIERRLAIYLDAQRDPKGLDMLKQAALARPQDPRAQQDLLNSPNVWTDEPTVRQTIDRLKGATGENSSRWRLYEARRLLEFAKTPEDRTRNAAQVARDILPPVLREDPKNISALLLSSDAYMTIDPPSAEQAVSFLTRAIDAGADQPQVRVRLISLLQSQGKADEARSRLEAFAREPGLDKESTRARAQLLLRQGMWAEAEADIASLGESMTQSDIVDLATAQQRRGELAAAATTFGRIAAVEKPEIAPGMSAVLFFAQRGDAEKAMQIARRLPDEPPMNARQVALAAVHEETGNYAEAQKILHERAKQGGNAEAWRAYASYLVRRGKSDDAAAAVASGLAIDAKNTDLLRLERSIKIAKGNATSAELFADATEADRRGPLAQLLEAEERLNRNPSDVKEIEAYQKRLIEIRDMEPTYLPTRRSIVLGHLHAASVARAAGDQGRSVSEQEAAAREATAIAAALPTDPRAARLAAETLLTLGRPEESLAMAREWRKRSLDDPYSADVAIAQLEDTLGRPAVAISVLQPYKDRIQAEAGENPQSLAFYARALTRAGREEEASEMMIPRARTDIVWARTYAEFGRLLVGRPEAARAWNTRAAAVVGDDEGGRTLLGQSWFDLAVAKNDKDAFAKVIETVKGIENSGGSERAGAAMILAASHEQIGQQADAERCYRIALEIIPDNPIALNNLAYLLIKQGRQPDESFSLAQRAVASAEKQGYVDAQLASFIDTLGVAALKIDKHADAEAAFTKGLGIDPSDPALLTGLAEAQAAQRKTAELAETMRRLDVALRNRTVSDQNVLKRVDALRQRAKDGAK